MTIYQFAAKNADGEDVSLDKYKKRRIDRDAASQCELTNSNYTQLKEMLDKYKDKGLNIVAFPSNQFANEEPACELDIKKIGNDKYKFEPNLYSKINVNGDDAHPLYKFLKRRTRWDVNRCDQVGLHEVLGR